MGYLAYQSLVASKSPVEQTQVYGESLQDYNSELDFTRLQISTSLSIDLCTNIQYPSLFNADREYENLFRGKCYSTLFLHI